jgi:type IV pilus assembly protein PilA
MKKEKGFTLIELLAVIVILAILMVIAVPKILNVIENSRKSAAESSIKLVKDAIKTQVTSENIMDTSFIKDDDGCYTFNFNDQTNGNAKELKLKNKESITGTIKYCNGIFDDNMLSFDGINMSTIICKRATTLHTDGTHTFGNKSVIERTLKSGDAFDCDVNGDEIFDEKTERFYYVSDYYNTSTKKFESDTAVLIYYNNVSGGKPNSNATYAYDSSKQNWHGPRTAIKQLPSTDDWKNIKLKNTTRAIITQKETDSTNGGKLPSNFSYSGKAARLLTVQEIREGTGKSSIPTSKCGELNGYEYLLENTKYSTGTRDAYWIENPFSNISGYAYRVQSCGVLGSTGIDNAGSYGVRPAIEVQKSNIEY